MLEVMFIVLGLTMFVERLGEKWDIFTWMQEKSITAPYKWLYDLLNCRFCQMFWISGIITIFVTLFNEYKIENIIIPFIVTGLKQLK